VAEAGEAYWLLDLIALTQFERCVATEEFQVWKLIVRSDRTATRRSIALRAPWSRYRSTSSAMSTRPCGHGGEMWSVELEVFHNPLAACPLAMDMLPCATHWFEQDGEVVCKAIWAKTVLSSVTELKSTH
jgi:uncharacterized protein DUF6876